MGAGTSSEQPSSVAITPARPQQQQQQAGSPDAPSLFSCPSMAGRATALESGVSPGVGRGAAGGCGQWQYSSGEDDGVWHDFSESSNDRIEEAFAAGAPSVEASVGRQLYRLEFAFCKMKQTSGAGAAPRAIRRTVAESAAAGGSPAVANLFPGDMTDGDANLASSLAPSHIRHSMEAGRRITINDRIARGNPESITLSSTAKAHNSLVYCAAFSTDGKTIATGGRDGTLRMWELDTGYIVRNFNPLDAVVLNCAIAPGKSLVASGADDNQLRLYNTNSSDPKTMPGHTHKVYGVDFTCDSRCIFTGSMDTTNKLWDVARGKCIHTFTGHTAPAFTVKCSPFTPNMVVSGADDNTVCVYDLRSGEGPTAVLRGHSATLWTVDINFDESLIASSGMDSRILLWDPRKPDAPLATVGTHGKAPVHCVEFCGDGRRLLSCARDSTWRAWDIEGALSPPTADEEAAGSHRDNEVCRVHAHDGVIFGVGYSHARSQVLSIGADAYVRLWNARL